MGNLRTVENRFTSGLGGKGLSIYEGINTDIERHIQVAHRLEGNSELRVVEKVGDLSDSYPNRAALYSLGRRATLHALATIEWGKKDVSYAELDFIRFWRARSADKVDSEDELAFLLAVHTDLRDGRQPATRCYEGNVVTRVAVDDLARQALYTRAGYADLGTNDNGDKKVLVRRY